MKKTLKTIELINKLVDTLIGIAILCAIVRLFLFPSGFSEWMYELFLSHLDKICE